LRILAIDPGCTESAYVVYDGSKVIEHAKVENFALLSRMRADRPHTFPGVFDLAIESIASYGMAVGAEVFETCVWSGRFIEAWNYRGWSYSKVYRKEVKMHLCGTMRAKDANVRQAIIDRYGGKEKAIGNKKTPGPLYGIKADVWAALAVAITYEGRKDAHD